jgi:hypothetical protein
MVGSYMRLKPKTYYKIGTKRISSIEFRIHDLPDNIANEEIEKSIQSILKGEPFFIKTYRSTKNNVIFTLKSDKAHHILKNIWSIEIKGALYHISLGYFRRLHMET